MNNQSISRGNRQSGIELLRILAAFGVIFQHYNSPHIGGAIRFASQDSGKMIVLTVTHVIMICAVDLFILITGYFMRDKKKRDLLKPISLLGMYVVFELLFYCVQELPKGEAFDFQVFLNYFIPHYWFVFVYVALYLISPYINFVWLRLDRKSRKILLGVTLGLFSVYPLIIDAAGYLIGNSLRGTSTVGLEGSDGGYTIVNFVLMYLLGCYLRDREDDETAGKQWKTRQIGLLLALNVAVLLGWTLLEKSVIVRDPSVLATPYRYHNPLVITEALLYFMLFKRLRIKGSRVINSLAAASYPSYLIHINLFRYCGIQQAAQGSVLQLIVHILVSSVCIYLVSWILYTFYSLITRPLHNLIDRHWKHGRTYSVG